jgi:NAD(P)H-quinone oxidoreductase subunit 5
LVLTFNTLGTFELSELFSLARDLVATSQVSATHIAIGWLLVLGAVTKSAQFPFHTWLPDTMETPTPVSALMHAGIVNAGGYLIIRMSPLVAMAPAALITLAVMGAFTACFAGVVMMTQTSVKRSLAYSTIAQMGFMMLQCGVGAFSAAMLHILAHSLYKAHAFLGSGSVVSQAMATTGAKSPKPGRRMNLACLLAAAATSLTAFAAVTLALDVDVLSKPGGLVLAFVLCLALTTWGWRLLSAGEPRTTLLGVAGIAGLCLAYIASYLAVTQLLQPAVASIVLPPTLEFVLFAIALAFLALFALHTMVFQRFRPNWLRGLQVHAANGFYIDAVYRRLLAPLARN